MGLTAEVMTRADRLVDNATGWVQGEGGSQCLSRPRR